LANLLFVRRHCLRVEARECPCHALVVATFLDAIKEQKPNFGMPEKQLLVSVAELKGQAGSVSELGEVM
jgi:hypothetical protein